MRPESLPNSLIRCAEEASIEEVVDRILDRSDGAIPDDVALWRDFPALMPGLSAELHMAHGIRIAASRARLQQGDTAVGRAVDSTPAEDIEYLRSQLRGYQILDRLGRGGQGAVYEGIQRSTGRAVAIKILRHGPLASESELARFQREVSVVARLRHDNIVAIFESGSIAGHHWYAMECVEDAEALDDYLLLHQFTIRRTVELFRQVVAAVAFAHQRGIIHRDIKPSNILVDKNGHPRVVDFGLAKDIATDEESLGISQQGQMLGTVPYLSPEQITDGSAHVDVRSDVYALGLVLYRLLTGHGPYPVTGTPDEIRRSICETKPAPMHGRAGDIPDDLQKIVFKALEKEPGRRYQSAAALEDDLARFLRGEAVLAKGDDAWYVLRKALGRRKKAVAISAAFLVLLFTSLVVVVGYWRKAEKIAYLSQIALDSAGYTRLGYASRDANRLVEAATLLDQAIEISKLADQPSAVILKARSEACAQAAMMMFEAKDFSKGDQYLAQGWEVVRLLDGIDAQTACLARLRMLDSQQLRAASADDRPTRLWYAQQQFRLAEQWNLEHPDDVSIRRGFLTAAGRLAEAMDKVGGNQQARQIFQWLRNQYAEDIARDPTDFEAPISVLRIDLAVAKSYSNKLPRSQKLIAQDLFACAAERYQELKKDPRYGSMLLSMTANEFNLKSLSSWNERRMAELYKDQP